MTWKDSLRPASFRGAAFAVFDTETTIGRRIVLHEYPLRDDPYAEDLGRKGREFTLNAFVIGDNYFGARDALIAALEDSSPGTLVHPTLGSKTVIPKDCRVHFKNTEGGIEYFQLTFVEAGKNSFPSSKVDTQGFSGSMADLGISSFAGVFSQLFSTINFPDFLSTGALGSLIGSGSGASGSIIGSGSSFSGILQNILQSQVISSNPSTIGTIPIGSAPTPDAEAGINFSNMQSMLQAFNANAATLVTAPAPAPVPVTTAGGVSIATTTQPLPLATAITNLIIQLTQVYPNDPATAIVAQQQLCNSFGLGLPTIPLTTTSRQQEAMNQQQLIDLVKNSSICEMARATSTMEWASRQDALTTLSTVLNVLEPQLLYLADNGYDDSYKALNNLRVAMVKDINTRAATLKNVKYVKINDSMPALVFAYKQYGDATQESDVVARNKVRNPCFIPPQSSLEVLV